MAHIEEGSCLFPPRFGLLTQDLKAFAAVFSVALDELQTSLRMWQGWRAHVDPQHVAKPQILAHALMHHLLVHATPSTVGRVRAHQKVVVLELTPHADHLDAFRCVCVD